MPNRFTGRSRWRAAMFFALGTCSCASLNDRFHKDCDLCTNDHQCHSALAKDPTVSALAHDLDDLERHIELFGSVVAKKPDVWGQARLTKFRAEFEEKMASSRNEFIAALQGSTARSDQSFFSNAFALSMAIQQRSGGTGGGASSATASAPSLIVTSQKEKKTSTSTQGGISEQTVTETERKPQSPAPPESVDVPELVNIPTSDFDVALLRPVSSTQVLPNAIGIAGGIQPNNGAGITIEPTEYLAQKARYLNYLDQIRRTNEGDDTADSPGYSLNLMRIPVSVLPGKRTDTGYGAEVTCTLTPVLGDDLLPVTMRNLILNDIVKQFSYPITVMLDSPEVLAAVDTKNRPGPCHDTDFDKVLRTIVGQKPDQNQPDCIKSKEIPIEDPTSSNFAKKLSQSALNKNFDVERKTPILKRPGRPDATGLSPSRTFTMPQIGRLDEPNPPKLTVVDRNQTPVEFRNVFFGISRLGLNSPSTKSRRTRNPYAVSEILEINGIDYLYRIIDQARLAFGRDIDAKGFPHLPDIRGWLQDEVSAAYRFLSQPEHLPLWDFCSPQLAQAIRTHDYTFVNTTRLSYFTALAYKNDPLEAKSLHAALAWAIIVEAALLNEQLILDMKEAASARGVDFPDASGHRFVLPCPLPEDRRLFNDYVQLRWPIHVFALDPAVEEQNLSDSLTTRREMQLALSLAFASGNLSARNLTRYARRLDAQYETITLNRTQVGFSHADDTFGWRFYPRFQTPDTPSNLKALIQEQFIGGPNRDQLLRQRRLEPGPRECIAIVLMPSFVPYLSCDVSTNWFRLDNPQHKELDSKDAMRLSRTVKTIQNNSGRIADGECYRDGDLVRLHRKCEQLSARLPLQTLSVQVPYENTLGGFEMFSTGVTDLAPELIGWYGAPGIDLEKETHIFLVGDHFNVNSTRVIAGNRECKIKKMLSRQVMLVRVPAGVMARDDNYIEVQVATPYGVTQTIDVPAVKGERDKPKNAEGYSISPDKIRVNFSALPVGKGLFKVAYTGLADGGPITISWHDALGRAPDQVALQMAFAINGMELAVPCPSIVVKSEGNSGRYVVGPEKLQEVFKALIEYFDRSGPFRADSIPLKSPIKDVKIRITPLGDASKTVECSNQIVIEFIGKYCAPQGSQ